MTPESKTRADSETTAVVIPNGAPPWITEQLIEKTLEVWQPYYSYRLTSEDALVIIKNVGRLFDSMSRGGGE